ncbi:MAG: SHOCT domain-containing protein [Salinispira sp.]
MSEIVLQIVKEYSTKIKDGHIFFAPDIPMEKLGNVLKSYGKGVAEEDALLLIDNTAFGNAKDGLLMTPSRLYIHNQMENPQHIDIADIQSVSFAEGWIISVIHVNDAKFFEVSIPEKHSLRSFTEMLREIAKRLHPNAGEKSPVQALKELKTLYDNGLITDTEYEEKRKQYVDQL